MSISALLSNTDEPSTDTTTLKNIPRLTQQTKRRSPDRDSNNTSPAMSRASLRQAPPAKPAATSTSSFRSGDADATDTELVFNNHGGSGGRNGSFRGFRYHDSVNLLTDDPDKTDSELDDGGFAHERAEYLKKIRKRHFEVEGRENENRKVGLHFDDALKMADTDKGSVGVSFFKIIFTINFTLMPNLLVNAPTISSMTMLWNM